jgi:hypothetical protein
MWSKLMAAFLRGKGQILWDVTVDTGYVQPMNFLAEGLRDMFNANNKAVNYGYKSLKSGFGNLHVFSIGRMPGDRTLRSLDASHAIPTCVLRFEDSGLRHRTPVLLTGQTGTHQSDRSDPPVRPVWHCCSTVFSSSVLALWINQVT